jgi:hypothetical protein
MSITIGEHVFDGPYTNAGELDNAPGVFAVIVANGDRGALIDVGQSEDINECVASHPKKTRWREFSNKGTLCYAVLYTPAFSRDERDSIQRDIREQYSRAK